MVTSRRNWSSESAVHCAATGGGTDAPTPPAHTASSSAALRSQLLPASTVMILWLALALLAEHRLGFGGLLEPILEGFEVLDGDRANGAALVIVGDRDRHVARVELGIDR